MSPWWQVSEFLPDDRWPLKYMRMWVDGLGWLEDRGASVMPWTGTQFASRHNKKLSGANAGKAAAQANAMLKAGVPEGEAIATANKQANKRLKARGFRGKKSRSYTGA